MLWRGRARSWKNLVFASEFKSFETSILMNSLTSASSAMKGKMFLMTGHKKEEEAVKHLTFGFHVGKEHIPIFLKFLVRISLKLLEFYIFYHQE